MSFEVAGHCLYVPTKSALLHYTVWSTSKEYYPINIIKLTVINNSCSFCSWIAQHVRSALLKALPVDWHWKECIKAPWTKNCKSSKSNHLLSTIVSCAAGFRSSISILSSFMWNLKIHLLGFWNWYVCFDRDFTIVLQLAKYQAFSIFLIRC